MKIYTASDVEFCSSERRPNVVLLFLFFNKKKKIRLVNCSLNGWHFACNCSFKLKSERYSCLLHEVKQKITIKNCMGKVLNG